MVVGLLADRGIRARVLNANSASAIGGLPMEATLPQVWVDSADDAGRAREVIDAFFHSRASVPPVKCPSCGEENPGSFDLCWACGAGLER